MDIFINERSFNNQAQSYNVNTLMQQLADTVQLLRTICSGAEVVIHSSLSSRKVFNNQTLAAWLSTEQDEDEEQGGEDITQPPLQAVIGIVLSAFSRGPYVEDLLAEQEHACYLNEEDHDLSAIAAASCLGGVVVSLEGHTFYPEGKLTLQLSRQGSDFAAVDVPHFISLSEVRKCRRRYIPNRKHHPNRAKGDDTPMELDREYDLFTEESESRLRHPDSDMPDTQCQRLLDSALPGGKQLYALIYGKNGRNFTLYEFKPDNLNGFHGYPVPKTEVPSEVVRALLEYAQNKL